MIGSFFKITQIAYFGTVCLASAASIISIALSVIATLTNNPAMERMACISFGIGICGLFALPLSLAIFSCLLFEWLKNRSWIAQRGCLTALAAILYYSFMGIFASVGGPNDFPFRTEAGKAVACLGLLCNCIFCILSYLHITDTVAQLSRPGLATQE
ncbi:MAG: hypothetical protein C0507_00525 [Cyanobacteria bacterium PR.3.49]|nr:hypothetical protein [Cyanobacteria bacterium PR.3.49]